MTTSLAQYSASSARTRTESLTMPERVGAFTTGAFLSGVQSLGNTGVDIINYGAKLTGNDPVAERWSTVETMRGIDETWGQYYVENKESIDLAGFVGTSILPGMLAVKGLNLLKSGAAGGSFARTLGYASTKQVEYLKLANADLVSQSGSLFTRLNGNLVKSIAAGAADNVLEAAVGELAIAATMKASPLLDNKSWGDMLSDGATSALVFGGGFGGLISAVKGVGVYTGAAKAIDKASNKYGTVALGEKIGLGAGDSVVSSFSKLSELPKEVLESDKILNYAFKIGGKEVTQDLNLGSRLENTLARTADKAITEMKATLTSGLGKGDPRIGEDLAEHMFKLVKVARNAPEHDLANTAHMAIANRFGGLVEAETLAASGNKLKKFRPDVALPDDYPQVFLNLRTGNTSLSAIPTAADLGGELSVKFGNVVSVGKQEISFSLDAAKFVKTGLDEAGSVEDTARHFWASTLKKVEGTIHEDDFSVLDKLVQSPELQQTGKITIRTKEGFEAPLEDFVGSSIREHLISKKAQYLEAQLLENPKTNLELLARKMNVTEDWIQETIAKDFAKVEEGAMRPLGDWAKREHLKLTYDKNVPRSWDQPGEGWLLHYEKVQTAKEARERAGASVLGAAWNQLPEMSADAVKQNANRTGSGAGLFTASDADYKDALGRVVQQSGIVVSKTAAENTKRALDAITPSAQAVLTKPQAAAELASTLELLRRTPSKDGWVLHQQPGASESGYILIKKSIMKEAQQDPQLLADTIAQAGSKDMVKLAHKESAQFWENFQGWRAEAQTRHSTVYNSTGKVIDWPLDELYAPPIDTRKLNHFAFLVPHEGKVMGSTDVGMLVAKTAAELENMAAQVGSDFKVVFKRDTEAFFKAKGTYEYDRALNKTTVNSAKERAGALSNFAPNMKPEETITEFLAYMERKETQIVRDAVELKYAEEFAQLRTLSEEAVASQTSKFAYVPKAFQSTMVKDPYGDYIKTALDISKQHEYPLMSQMNEFVDNLGKKAYQVVQDMQGKAGAGTVTWEEAEASMQRVGLGGAINKEAWTAAQVGSDKNLARKFVSMSNTILATTQLAWDTANSLVNIISSPIRMAGEIQAIKKLDPATFAQLTGIATPDGASTISASKLMANAVRNYWGPEGAAKLARFEAAGFVPTDLKFHRQLVDDIASAHSLTGKSLQESFERIADKGAKITGNQFAERFTRFVAADIVDQLTEPLVTAGKMSRAEADSFTNIFVNRVQGNYHASQRPIAFQGTVGSAISLFQTYQFGMLQQLGRYIQEGNTKALFVTAGMQTSIFGMNGLPFFDAVNSHIIGKYSTNPEHKDLYSAVGGHPMGDWLLYGSASAFPLWGKQGPALYSRGDLNPRHITLLPTSPDQVPFISAYTKLAGTLGKVTSLLGDGAPAKEAILFGLEHNGMSRPLAGLAQAVQGYSTTGKANINAYNDLMSLGTAWRLMGAKPVDEAVAVQQKFRQDQYQAYDKQKLEMLGEVVKMKVRSGEVPSDDEYMDLMDKYTARGGQIENFTKAMNRWTKDAEESVVNKLMEKNNSPRAQRMIEIMGGVPLQEKSSAEMQASGE